MKIPTDCQLAMIRFAYRVYSTGSTYGAPAAAVVAANSAIGKLGLNDHEGPKKSSSEFKAMYIKRLV